VLATPAMAGAVGVIARWYAGISVVECRRRAEPAPCGVGGCRRRLDRCPHPASGLVWALTELGAGNADGLVVAKLDRLPRSVADFAGLLRTATKQGWSVVVPALGIDTVAAACCAAASDGVAKTGIAVGLARSVAMSRGRVLPQGSFG
jgi:hypothetical protein